MIKEYLDKKGESPHSSALFNTTTDNKVMGTSEFECGPPFSIVSFLRNFETGESFHMVMPPAKKEHEHIHANWNCKLEQIMH